MTSVKDQYQAEINKQVDASLKSLKRKLSSPNTDPTSSLSSVLDKLASDISAAIDSSAVSADSDSSNIKRLLSPPPERDDIAGSFDYGLATFALAKDIDKSPAELAEDLANKLAKAKDAFAKVEATGPYINFRLEDGLLIEHLKGAVEADRKLASSMSSAVAVIDFSSPNVAKPFGVNHLRSTVIGEAIARLLEATGWAVIRDNHLGDWGTQFGNLLAAYDTYSPGKDFESLSINELNELYVRYSQEMKTDDALVLKGREYFARLSSGDEELLARWLHCVNQSREDFARVYMMLGIEFDTQIGEAYFDKASVELTERLAKDRPQESIVVDEDGSIHINHKHPVVLRTGDGYPVYAARDLSAIEFRSKTYNPNNIIYVVGHEQGTSFEAVFKVAKELGLNQADSGETELEHVGFGLLLDSKGKKLSTRKGTSGSLEDLVSQLEDKAHAEILKRNPDMESKEASDNARILSIGALIWHDLRTDRNTNVRFDADKMLELGSGSVVDVLYSYVRSQRILENLGDVDLSNTANQFSSDTEHLLALRLSEFTDIITRAAEDKSPHILVGYLHELAQIHGNFYETSPVISEEDKTKQALRALLHQCYIKTIKQGMNLLNIKLPTRL
ncbi:MAG: arginine--tRNA ligase [Candidatus Saccharimonadales bacterium]